MENTLKKPRIAVHKFSSCDGCQLAFLNCGECLINLSNMVDIVHFIEAGPIDEEAEVDIAFIEGSVSTPSELERIKSIRDKCTYLIALGACATSGGLQALRNLNHVDAKEWIHSVYAQPQYISSLDTATPISDHVKVDFQLYGCPVNTTQVLQSIRTLLLGVMPKVTQDPVCMECKRKGNVCVMVTQSVPCMGPVTRSGCRALCPSFNRDCYGCFGPSENPNGKSLGDQFEKLGLKSKDVARRFWFINSNASAFQKAGEYFENE